MNHKQSYTLSISRLELEKEVLLPVLRSLLFAVLSLFLLTEMYI